MRRRASNQSTEAAAEAIATFMEVDCNGWQLLSTLNLLVGEGDALAEVSKQKSMQQLAMYLAIPKFVK